MATKAHDETGHLEAILLNELDQHCAKYLHMRALLNSPGLSAEEKDNIEADLAGVITLLESSAEQYAEL
jgi:hypothetical protein